MKTAVRARETPSNAFLTGPREVGLTKSDVTPGEGIKAGVSARLISCSCHLESILSQRRYRDNVFEMEVFIWRFSVEKGVSVSRLGTVPLQGCCPATFPTFRCLTGRSIIRRSMLDYGIMIALE